MKKPLMYLVRHGSTTDTGIKVFRGQRDSALDKKGFLDAHALKEFFEKKEWDRLFCSKMTRAIQTGTIICDDQSEYQPEPIEDFKPWDVGFITGLPKTEENEKKMNHFIENPDDVPEGGESLTQFRQRVWPLLAEAIQLGWEQGIPCIVVGHSSIVHTLNDLMDGKHKDIAVKPGGVVEIYFEDGEILHRPIYKASKEDDSSFSGTHS